LPAAVLDAVLAYLASRGELQETQEDISRGGILLDGRKSRRYVYMPSDEFLPNELPVEFHPKPDEELPAVSVQMGSTRCLWCRALLPIQVRGQPRRFCRAECRAASTLAAQHQMLQILQRPKDPYVFNATARLIVAADLTSRGLSVHIALTSGPATPLVLLYKGKLLRVGTYIADETGAYYEGDDGCDVRAVVRRDGALRYFGIDFGDAPVLAAPAVINGAPAVLDAEKTEGGVG
jgi:hypothetical protein